MICIWLNLVYTQNVAVYPKQVFLKTQIKCYSMQSMYLSTCTFVPVILLDHKS